MVCFPVSLARNELSSLSLAKYRKPNRIRGLPIQIQRVIERREWARVWITLIMLDRLDRKTSLVPLALLRQKQLANRGVKLAPGMGTLARRNAHGTL
jgi:hypothetical protein